MYLTLKRKIHRDHVLFVNQRHLGGGRRWEIMWNDQRHATCVRNVRFPYIPGASRLTTPNRTTALVDSQICVP